MRRWGQWIVAVSFPALVLAAGDARAQSRDSEAAAPVPLPWAKPLQGGPMRVAAVFPLDGSSDLAALEAGFDLRASLFPYRDGEPSADHALGDALTGKIDALIVSSIALAQLSETTRAALAARVGGGVGLIWIAYSTSGEPELKEFLAAAGLGPIEPAPDFAARAGGAALTGLQPGLDQVFAYSGDNSRAVELRFWKPRPQGHALAPLTPIDALDAPPAYENYLAIAGGALRWAAGRDPEAAIAAVEDRASGGPREEDTPPQLSAAFVKRMKRAALPGVLRPFALRLDRPAPRDYALRVQARYADRPIRWSYHAEEILRKGAQEAVVYVPIGAGACFLDVWIMDGPEVVDWFTQALDLDAPPELGQVSFGAAAIEANDRLRISAEVRKDLLRGDLQRPQPATVYLRVTDALGRVVAMKDIPVSNAGATVAQELALVDLIGPYARAELFAAPVVDTPLSWWIGERAAYRRAHISVRQPLPEGLALIVDEPGEGSFAGSALRKHWTAAGVNFIFPAAEPDLGNIAADGMRIVARLGDQDDFDGDHFDPRSRPGIALRQAAVRYAAGRPGLYVVSAAADSAGPPDPETARAAIERAVREKDPKAAVALLDGLYSAAGTGGFLVLPADLATLEAAPRASAAYMAVRAPLPTGDHALAEARRLPWLAAIYQANAVWISPGEQALNNDSLTPLFDETNRVREGFDVLFRRATPAPSPDDAAFSVSKNFSGVARRFQLGETNVFVVLSDPAAAKATIRVRAQDAKSHVYVSTAPKARASRGVTLKLQPGEATVVCILPYEVSRVALEVPASTVAGRRLTIRATVKTRGALPGDHVLRVSCFGPLGGPLPHYSRTVFAPAGSCATSLPLAFNDTPGTYRIAVRDVLSGVSGEATVTVLASQEAARPADR